MRDAIIIGGGIAGCTAAIYASRKKMDFLLITKEFGGQFSVSGDIQNYPGVVKTNGVEFNSIFEKQLEFNNVKPNIGEEAEKIEKTDKGFEVHTSKDNHETRTVIIATGSKPRKLDVPGEKEFANKGVTYCSICDGPLFSGKEIAIIGGGNSAMEGVDFTRDIAKKIYLINIGEELNGHEYLMEKVKSYKNVEIINNAKTTQIQGDKFVTGIAYEKDGEKKKLGIEGVIVEIGRIPMTEFLEGFVDVTQSRHVKIDCQGRTSVEGVFAAGDCASGQEYQYTIAAGQGCIALLKASRYLANKKQ